MPVYMIDSAMEYEMDKVERCVERKMDRLDHALLKGFLSQEEYDRQVKSLDKWATEEYKEIRNEYRSS